MTTLEALRIYGPIDAFDIQTKTKSQLHDIVDDIVDLQKGGYAFNPHGYAWDVTEAGENQFTKLQAVRRDEARACVGVRS